MAFQFYLTNEFNNRIFKVTPTTDDDNKLFQYKCIVVDDPLPATDTGHVWHCGVDPTTLAQGALIYNTFSQGYFGVTGDKIAAKNGKPIGSVTGAITFIPNSIVNTIVFTSIQASPGYYHINNCINKVKTNEFLAYDVEEDTVTLVSIPNMLIKNPDLLILWRVIPITSDVTAAT